MALALANIPFIVANVIAAHICHSPPQPTPQAGEQAKYNERQETKDFPLQVVWLIVLILLAVPPVFGTCEIYMILSSVYPTMQVPLLDRIVLPFPSRRPAPSDFYRSTTFVVGSMALYAGAILRYQCYRVMGRHFTFPLSLQKEHKLITTGPYSVVRHPAYSGEMIALPGLLVTQFFSPGTWWTQGGMWETFEGRIFSGLWISYSAWFCWSLCSRVLKEDMMLKLEFKEQWANWARMTPYAVIPYLW